MEQIEVKILEHNLDRNMSLFLAKLTQRGHQISCMKDLMYLYKDNVNKDPSKNLLSLPHSTIRRMNYMTVAITGLSTKAVSQIRTHATRLTFVSTSTQYSSYETRGNNWTLPPNLSEEEQMNMLEAYEEIEKCYAYLIDKGVDKDKASYLLPQGLRKALIISGNLDAWQYVLRTRLCHRNTEEVQHIMRLILEEIKAECGPEYIADMLPLCTKGDCKEGKFCCGRRFEYDYK